MIVTIRQAARSLSCVLAIAALVSLVIHRTGYAQQPVSTVDPLLYLNQTCDPYYVGLDFPKLTTAQWFGEEGVEAVVILSIDDMRKPDEYEKFLRPILDRLKEIDGRAGMSIFANELDPKHPQVAAFLKEGVSIEVHTMDHPCPLLSEGNFAKAKGTYDRCVDSLAEMPGSRAVAYRMPCCDSLNSPSPRFWAEIFDRKTPRGNYLHIDSSVFNITTAADTELPQEFATNEKGEDRFRRYLPFPSYVNTIENYPYPYMIGKQCWEFPCMVPSDWEAQNIQKPNNPDTVRDMKIALDTAVVKKGMMSLCFHPWGWMRNDQVVQLINHAQEKYGNKVKFISFAEAHVRLKEQLLKGQSIRSEEGDAGVRLVDVNQDGFLDVMMPTADRQVLTRVWDRENASWSDAVAPIAQLATAGIGRILSDVSCSWISTTRNSKAPVLRTLTWKGENWGSSIDDLGGAVTYQSQIQLIDCDGNGTSELIVTNAGKSQIYMVEDGRWVPAKFGLPTGTRLLNRDGHDAGLRFRDLNADGKLDVVFANAADYSVHLFTSMEQGWSKTTISGKQGDENSIPPIVRGDGTNNGAWFHSDHLWVQNEQTDKLDSHVDRASYAELLGKKEGKRTGKRRRK